MRGEESVQLRSVCVKIGSGATPRGGKEAYKGGATTLIRSQNVHNHGFYRDGLVRIDDTQSFELRSVEVMPDDVLLNITGDSVARCCQVVEDVLPARVNQHVAIVRPQPEVLDARYLRYVLVSNEYQLRLLGMASAGATRPALTKTMIEELEIPLPPLPEQRRIAKILGDLDDKIELNRKMNETLEQMARALFKSWFADFDPVRAKMEGRTPTGMDAATAALFPDRLVDSELGPIPEGWEVKALGEVIAVLEVGGRPKGGVSGISEGVPSIGAESIVGIGRFDYSKTKYVPVEYFESMRKGHVENHDVLLYKDGGRPGEYEPHVSMFGGGFPFDQCCINEHVYRIRVSDTLSQEYLYFWLNTEAALDEMRVKGTGVAIPGLNSSAVRTLSILVPNNQVVDTFNMVAANVVGKIFRNSNQSRTLSTLRDTLLPKLVGGEVRVGKGVSKS